MKTPKIHFSPPTGVLLMLTVISAVAQTTGEASKGSMTEGVAVHGNWTLEIRNADGSLASRHVLKNSLAGAGPTDLINFLSAQTTPGAFKIVSSGCVLDLVGSLTYGLPLRLEGTYKLSTSPTAPPGTTYFITGMATVLNYCDRATPPSQCTGTSGSGFTTLNVSPSIEVKPGQLVKVTVDLSFS